MLIPTNLTPKPWLQLLGTNNLELAREGFWGSKSSIMVISITYTICMVDDRYPEKCGVNVDVQRYHSTLSLTALPTENVGAKRKPTQIVRSMPVCCSAAGSVLRQR